MARFGLTGLSHFARRTPAPVLRALGVGRSLGRPFAAFERDDGSHIDLLDAYRDSVKSSWRVYWWQTRLLFGLRARVALPPELDELLLNIERSRTLPVTPVEIASAAQSLVDQFPHEVRRAGSTVTNAGVPTLELKPDPRELAALAATYRAHAHAVGREIASQGIKLETARILDAGTGSGYLAFALAGLGADVVGVDLDPETYVWQSEREAMRELLAQGGRVVLERGNVHDLAYEDNAFDVVCSLTAVEHFTDARGAMRELSRVVRRGGVVYHVVDPWFGKRGGHSLCTLDFPWGHARLTPSELERYLMALRPYEAADAIADARGAFQRPPLTLTELRQAVEEAGIEIIRWEGLDISSRDPHRAVLDRGVRRDCRRANSAVSRADLLTLTLTIVGRPRGASRH